MCKGGGGNELSNILSKSLTGGKSHHHYRHHHHHHYSTPSQLSRSDQGETCFINYVTSGSLIPFLSQISLHFGKENCEKNEGEWTGEAYITKSEILAIVEACKAVFWHSVGLVEVAFDSSGLSAHFYIRLTPSWETTNKTGAKIKFNFFLQYVFTLLFHFFRSKSEQSLACFSYCREFYRSTLTLSVLSNSFTFSPPLQISSDVCLQQCDRPSLVIG